VTRGKSTPARGKSTPEPGTPTSVGIEWENNINGPAPQERPGPGTGRSSPECALTLTPLAAAARLLHDAVRDRTYQRDTQLGQAVAQYLAWKRLGASERTLAIYEGYLARLCVDLARLDPAVSEVTPEMLLEALAVHPRKSLRLVRTSYSGFFKWASQRGHCDRNPVELLPQIREASDKIYDVFSGPEQQQLIKAAGGLPLPWVQRLRVLCFLDLGVRSDEGRLLRPGDFDLAQRVVVVTGKGNKQRVIPFGEELFKAFVLFRNRPLPNARDPQGNREDRPPRDSDYLFFRYGLVKARGQVTWCDPHRPLQPRALRTWWSGIVEAAGISYRSLHMCRHTLGTDLSTAGEDLGVVQDWLGHASPDTTKVYIHNSRSRLNRGRGALDAYRKAQGG
jgi:integrase/recombinase XerC